MLQLMKAKLLAQTKAALDVGDGTRWLVDCKRHREIKECRGCRIRERIRTCLGVDTACAPAHCLWASEDGGGASSTTQRRQRESSAWMPGQGRGEAVQGGFGPPDVERELCEV